MAASDEKRHFQLLLVACFRHRSCPAYRSRQDRQFAGAKLAAQIGLQAGVPRKSNCYNSKGLLPGLRLYFGDFRGEFRL
jgi:hypothetical protein